VIVPLTPESDWLAAFTGLPAFAPGTAPVVLLSPHPDDETLGAGALIASLADRGQAVTVVAVTDGENAYTDHEGLAALRIQEQDEALRILSNGRAIMHRLHLTDSGVTPQTGRLIDALLPLVTADTHLIAPWTGDFHPDHEACGTAAVEVARRTGARLSFYFFWTWHRGTPEAMHGLRLQAFPIEPALLSRKLTALAAHRSQLHREAGDPILPENLLAPARRNFEVFAAA
jgi:LmbE family N-acetylglucosaminyl deacetylase